MIKEDLLYYLWQTKRIHNPRTTDGRLVEILEYGYRNEGSGPDFHNAKIKIDGIIWAGNVEMHVYSGDWHKHNHHWDGAYQNVILHVVYENNKDVMFSTKQDLQIPTIEVKSWIDPTLLHTYESLQNHTAWIPCANHLDADLTERLSFSYPALVAQKWQIKMGTMSQSIQNVNENLEQLLFTFIARAFGGPTNGDAFERLASTLPYQIIQKNSFDPLRVESILFGNAGLLLNDVKLDEYNFSLLKEYKIQKAKYQFTEMDPVFWKFGKLLPAGFPTIRLAQMSAFFVKNTNLVSRVVHAEALADFAPLFEVEPNEYWKTHYVFGKPVPLKNALITSDLRERILINAILPFIFLYGNLHGEESLKDRAMELLDKMPAEKNMVIQSWKKLGTPVRTALDSQALLFLKKDYCSKIKCLSCSVGTRLLTHSKTN
ncbi:MAG TPA: DUF2851 family protein [Saprospiraceae bacterium]|nr:DUF2851 family protein [Saprospiraceae bacterium]HPN68030.1 DUF2851 family protein [Saprospiraceae bacterium]